MHQFLSALRMIPAAGRYLGGFFIALMAAGIDLSRFPMDATPGDHLAFLGRCGADKAPDLALRIARRLVRLQPADGVLDFAADPLLLAAVEHAHDHAHQPQHRLDHYRRRPC